MQNHILVIDDESAIRDMLRMSLENDGFIVSDASSAHQAQSLLEKEIPDLILLDWMMPGISGIDFASRLKRDDKYRNIGIIMLTARDDENDQIRGLDIGADDYVTKPFSTRELSSRIRAVLRRLSQPIAQDAVEAGKIKIDTETHRVTIDDNYLNLSPTEFRLLHFFMTHPERVFSRTQLLDQVWGEHIYVEERTVDVHIRRLRKVLESYDCDNYIQTVRSVGYRFSIKTE